MVIFPLLQGLGSSQYVSTHLNNNMPETIPKSIKGCTCKCGIVAVAFPGTYRSRTCHNVPCMACAESPSSKLYVKFTISAMSRPPKRKPYSFTWHASRLCWPNQISTFYKPMTTLPSHLQGQKYLQKSLILELRKIKLKSILNPSLLPVDLQTCLAKHHWFPGFLTNTRASATHHPQT